MKLDKQSQTTVEQWSLKLTTYVIISKERIIMNTFFTPPFQLVCVMVILITKI